MIYILHDAQFFVPCTCSNWVESRDESGTTFYENKKVGVTQWEIPRSLEKLRLARKAERKTTPAAAPAAEAPATLPQAAGDDEVDAKPVGESRRRPRRLSAVEFTEEGEKYFVDLETGETTWEDPEPEAKGARC